MSPHDLSEWLKVIESHICTIGLLVIAIVIIASIVISNIRDS